VPKKQKLVLIDAHALIHRAYHALPPMRAADGTPTGAVYGFTTTLLKVLAAIKPTHVAAAFDMAGPTFRHKAYKEYKAHRQPADDDLVAQFKVVREVARAFNIPVVEKQGFEADDIIGTLTAQLDGAVAKVVVTGDLDTLQLVDRGTSVFTLRRGIADTIIYGEQAVREKYGFGPRLVPDYKGLCGDPSDNIPGVAGIGEKTAKDLIGRYGSIENVYEHLDELPKRARTFLTGHKREALFSRKLATIKRDVPVSFKLSQAELADFDPEEVRRIFARLGFKSLINRIPKSVHGGVQPTLFRKTQNSKLKTQNLPDHYHLAASAAEQKKLRALLGKQKVIAFDTENDRLGARQYPIVGMSFSFRPAGSTTLQAWYVPVTPKTVLAWKGLLENPNVAKVGHNLKYDFEVLQQSGITLGPIEFDSMLAAYLLQPGSRQYGLDVLAANELGYHCIPITALIGEGKQQKAMSDVPFEELAPYACEDAEISFRLYEVLSRKIIKEGLTRVLTELELPLISVLAHLELTGVKIEAGQLEKLGQKVGRRITGLEQDIWRLAGAEFNIKSTQQLRRVLYEKLKLPTDGISRTQSGYSTAAAELAKLRAYHEIIPLLEDYRELTKLENTYIDTLPDLIDSSTGRIHTSFNQTVAATGRLSSADPNLQNIPARTELGQEIRAAFIAPRGRRLVKADYSQLELRVAAHLAQDEKMLAAFRAGEDIHTATAAWVYGISLEQVTRAQRRRAKTLNFGVLYGMGPQNFAQAADVSAEEARSFIERYRQQYAGIARMIAATIEQAEALGFVETMRGRRRYVPEINARSPAVRAAAERAAFNFPIQGTAADILKTAMIRLDDRLQSHYPAAAMILTVHDELVCEAPAGQAKQLAGDMKKIMSGAFALDVPLVVDVAVGLNWRDLTAV
jgi:DNA polymerase I